MSARLVVLLLALLLPLSVFAQPEYVVTDLRDLPDDNLEDQIFAPQTLRAAIQNLNRYGSGGTIRINDIIASDTIKLASSLPAIFEPCTFLGKGIHIKGNQFSQGLTLVKRASGSKVEDVFLFGFDVAGLIVQCDNSTFNSIESYDNNGTGVVLNDADNNVFQRAPNKITYAGMIVYGNKGSSGFGMYIDDESEGNRIVNGYFGYRNDRIVAGNERAGLLLGGAGTVLEGCLFANNATEGIQLDMRTTDGAEVLIKDCFFQVTIDRGDVDDADTIRPDDQGQGIYGLRAHNVRIDGCWFGTHRTDAIDMAGIETTNITITKCWVGIMPGMPTKPFPIGAEGIRVGGDNIRVDSCHVAGSGQGITLQGSNVVVQSNTVGVVVPGDSTYSTRAFGILFGPCVDCTVGDDADTSKGNIVFGTGLSGIGAFITESIDNATVSNNTIGFEQRNGKSNPVGRFGISMFGEIIGSNISNNIVHGRQGGIQIGTRFVDRGNGLVPFTPIGVYIYGNDLGTSNATTGTINDSAGIVINIAGVVVDSNDVVYGNHGIVLESDSSTFADITRNRIGRPAGLPDTTTTLRGNGIHVIKGNLMCNIGLLADNTTGNTIIGADGVGVHINEVTGRASNVTIAHNFMCDNKRGGIELGSIKEYYSEGRDNDDADADVGPNGFQNTVQQPTLQVTGASVTYGGTLKAKPLTTYHIQSYFSGFTPANQPELAQGCLSVENFSVTTNSEGKAEFERVAVSTFLVGLLENGFITYLVTDPNGSTSQYSLDNSLIAVDLVAEYDTALSGEFTPGVITTNCKVWNNANTSLGVVEVRDTLPAGFVVESVSTTIGSASVEEGVVVVRMQQLNGGDTILVTVVGRPAALGEHVRVTTAIAPGVPDPFDNNADTIRLNVTDVVSVEETDGSTLRINAIDGEIRVLSNQHISRIVAFDVVGNLVKEVALGSTNPLEARFTMPNGYWLIVVELVSKETQYEAVLVTP